MSRRWVKEPRRRVWVGVMIAVIAVATTVAVLMLPGARVATSDSPAEVSRRIGAITQAFTAYAQNNHDDFPPPDRALGMLVAAGFLDPEIAAPPGKHTGEPAFFVVKPESPTGRWGNGVQSPQPIVVSNPAAWGSSAGVIGFGDSHSEYLRGAQYTQWLEPLRPRLVPLR